jgi:ankyrin repeat protein
MVSLLPPQQLPALSDRAQSTHEKSTHVLLGLPTVPPNEFRRFRSGPSAMGKPGAAEQRFTDRLLTLLTSTTVPAECGASATAEVIFGADPPARPGAGPKPGTCAVCMEDVPESMLLCLNTECSSRFCKTCIAGYATEAVSKALYAVPWLHCPGCRARVPTALWSQYAPEALAKYKSNAEAMLEFRCGECHEPSTLFVEHSDKVDPSVVDSFQEANRLKEAWAAFASAECQPDSLLDLLCDHEVKKVLPSIVDIERRTCLHLAHLRKTPFILTPCCDAEFCFKCKVGSHHDGETCEERQRAELDINIQFCPECEVPTVRTEGCDHIVCVCGTDWTWQKYREVGYALGPLRYLQEMLDSGELDPNWTEDDSEQGQSGLGKSLLMFVVGEGRLENAKVLIEAGADIHACNRRGLSVLLYTLGAAGAFQQDCVELIIEKGAQSQQPLLTCKDPILWMQTSGTSLPGFKKLIELCSLHINGFSIDFKHDNVSLLQVALQKGRTSLAKELVDKYQARVDRLAPFWFLQGKISDRPFFDQILASSGLGVNDVDDTAESGVNTLLKLAMGMVKDLARHLILQHKASATFGIVAKPNGFWSMDLPITKDLFDALVLQGANVWERISSPQLTTMEEQSGWLLNQVLIGVERRSRNTCSTEAQRAAMEEAEYLLRRILALWSSEADSFARTAAGATLLVKAVELADPARKTPVSLAWSLAKHLIDAGASLEAKDGQGRTVLLKVASSEAKCMEQLEVLLKAGANARVINGARQTASALAARVSWDEGVAILQAAESKQQADAEAAAFRAAQSGDGTLHNVGLRIQGPVQCTECNQRFDSQQIRDIHWRFLHATSQRPED